MKKLAVFFIVLISLVVIAGCNHSQKTVTRFSSEADDDSGTKTTITKLDDGAKTEPAAIEIPSKDDVKDTGDAVDTSKSVNDVAFGVTYPATDSIISDKGYHLIQGTTPKNTDKIMINGKALSKYNAGSTKWNYIAAASLGTLNNGINYYRVSAVDSKGNELGSKSFTINYKGIENVVLAKTGSSSVTISIIIAIIGYLALSYFRRPALTKIQK